MAADVGYLVRALNNSKGDHTSGLVTRDFLGESFSSSSSEIKIDHSQELDLDLQVPAGWEKRLDLKSGKVYLQKCSSEQSRSATREPRKNTKFSCIKRPLKTMEETASLDLKLESKSIASTMNNSNSCIYQSFCTLDKVKSALDRAKNNEHMRKMFLPRSSKSPSTSSTSTKVTLELHNEEVDEDERTINSMSQPLECLLTAAGCPNCLMYVMISKENPKCPKCNSNVSLPVMKKPRIDLDLNISI